jgi:hypothetical protein
VIRSGVESATPPAVMDAIRAEVLIEVAFPPPNAAHALPLEEIPVFTTTTEPGFVAYWVLFPLMIQIPPRRPSV